MFTIEHKEENGQHKLVIVHSTGLSFEYKNYGSEKPAGRTVIEDNRKARDFIDFIFETQIKK